VCVQPRLRAAVLTQKVALQGRVRVLQRLSGLSRFAGGPTVNLSGRVRQTTPRLRATSISLLRGAAPVRVAPRLKGQLRKVWLQGRICASMPRLVGQVTGVGTGGEAELRGVLRTLPARMHALELTTTFSAAESMCTSPRLHAVLGMVGVTIVPLAGQLRALARVVGQPLPQKVALRGTICATSARTQGTPGWITLTYLAGRSRLTPVLLRGARLETLHQLTPQPVRSTGARCAATLAQRLALSGAPLRQTAPRLRAELNTDHPQLSGTVRVVVARAWAVGPATKLQLIGLLRSLGARTRGTLAKARAYQVDDRSGAKWTVIDLSGGRYTVEDKSGPRYTVEDIGDG
jgi:hypothetical protein